MTNPQQNIILNGEKLTESISPKVKNKTRVPNLNTTIKHIYGSFGDSNQSRKRNKKNPGWKRSRTLSLQMT